MKLKLMLIVSMFASLVGIANANASNNTINPNSISYQRFDCPAEVYCNGTTCSWSGGFWREAIYNKHNSYIGKLTLSYALYDVDVQAKCDYCWKDNCGYDTSKELIAMVTNLVKPGTMYKPNNWTFSQRFAYCYPRGNNAACPFMELVRQ